MRQLKLVALLILITISSGCAYLDVRSPNVPEKIDELIAEQQYGRAQAILSSISASHPDYSQLPLLREETDKQAMLYEQQVLAEGKELEQQGKWYLAKKHYEHSLKNLPDSVKLQAAQQSLHLKQVAKVAALEFDLLVAQGEWLKRKLAIQQALSLLTSSSWFRTNRYEAMQKKAGQVAGELGRRGKFELEQKNLVRAAQAFNLAMELRPSPAIEEANKVLVLKRQQAIIQSRKHMQKKLLNSLQKALDQNQLSEAPHFVTQLKLLGKLGAEEEQLIQQLESLIHKQVQEDIDLGIEHYGQGRYQQAIVAWQNVLALEPGNEQAGGHIERAKRILEKLQRLREGKAE